VKPGTMRERPWAALPAVVLAVVAATQIVLTRAQMLSPWKGGGFGMFSTTDDAGRRRVRVYVTAPERSEEITISPSLEDAAVRAGVLPGARQLTRLARRVVERERRNGRPVEAVRIETWGIEYAPDTLAATSRLARTFDYRVDAITATRP
jgi:hypothetical protein